MEANGCLDSPATLAYHAAMATFELIEARTDEAPRRPREPQRPRPRQSLVDHPPSSELAFPGCKPVPLPREELETWDGRFEFWDGATETAWVCEPNSPYHEKPGGALPSLAERIAAVRGSPITCYGSMDLMVRDEHGAPQRILQADQSLYLHPERARLPGAVAMEWGEHDFPDVVLEVDHTTNVYRGKLRLYEAWGFPEVWVEVPNYRAASRPKSRRAGLTIHVLEGGVYRESAESVAFPGLGAEELHVAFNERMRSAVTCAVLERVGSMLGAREGTGPDDDPMLRSLRGQSWMEGRTEGLAEGERKGRADTLAKVARRMLRSRGVEVSEGLLADPVFAASSEDAVFEAALACADEAEFLATLMKRRGQVAIRSTRIRQGGSAPARGRRTEGARPGRRNGSAGAAPHRRHRAGSRHRHQGDRGDPRDP